jgi:uncharacterized protein (DUF488 family)
MEIYTIGFAQKSAEAFFGALRKAGIKKLVDIRLNNTSQLAGFTKRDDLKFFLKELCSAEYFHEPLLAPTLEILNSYKKKKISWQEYEQRFLELMAERRIEEKINQNLFYGPTVLLCSEAKADRCHRRLVLDYLKTKWENIKVLHL